MQPFTVAWDEADLRRLRERVRDYRFPVAPENAGWRYGCDPEFLRRLCAYWVDGFDVRAAEAKLNRFPQVLHRVENIDIHAVHVVGGVHGDRGQVQAEYIEAYLSTTDTTAALRLGCAAA